MSAKPLSSKPHLHLSNQLCLSLYSTSNAVIRAYRPLLQAMDLTYPQYLVMLALWQEDGLAVKHICERTRLETGTVTPLLKRLEQKGLIVRAHSDLDERQKVISLTPAGQSLLKQADAVPGQLGCLTGMDAQTVLQLRAEIETLYQKVLQAIELQKSLDPNAELEQE